MIENDLIQVYFDLLINRTDIWYRQNLEGGYSCVKPGDVGYEPVSPALIRRHLSGQITCGWNANDAENMTKSMTYDFDHEDGQEEKVVPVLEAIGLQYLIEGRRPGRPGHYRILFDEKVSAEGLQLLDQWIRKQAGIPATKNGGAEFFPKPGKNWMSQIRGALGVHLKPGAQGAIGWFEGPTQDIQEQLRWLAEQPLNSAKNLNALMNKLYAEEQRRKSMSLEIIRLPRTSKGKFAGGFHILDHVTDIRQAGDRFLAQCPVCAEEGHDRSKDNLHIALEGTWYGCWYGGWNMVHEPAMIRRSLLSG